MPRNTLKLYQPKVLMTASVEADNGSSKRVTREIVRQNSPSDVMPVLLLESVCYAIFLPILRLMPERAAGLRPCPSSGNAN
jgi:hypothetical protein